MDYGALPMIDGAFQNFETLIRCPVCESKEFALAFPSDLQHCKRCDVFFRSPRPTQEDIKRSYDTDTTFKSWEPEEEPREKMWERRCDLIERYQKGGRMLDVGTGDGHFLSVARKRGFSPSATELSDCGLQRCRERGFEVIKGQLLEIDLPPSYFDVITMWHVLEHVPNPREILSRVHDLLRPKGIFAVAVPNEENHFFRHRSGLKRSANPLGSNVWGHEIHLTHFQPSSFRSTLRRTGFEVLDFGVDDIYIDRSLRNLSVLNGQKTLSRLFGWHFSMAMYAIARKN